MLHSDDDIVSYTGGGTKVHMLHSDDDMVSYTGSLQKYTCCTHFPQCVTNCQILEIQLLTWQA